jgi:N-acetylmuramoyl-L-alanine amidase
MPGYYSVKQGDHLAGIAEQYGFPNFSRIWDHPNNAELKKKRGNPNVLYEGDNLFIPDPEQQVFDRPTDQKHKFVVSGEPLDLLLVLKNIYGEPVAKRSCKLQVGLNQYSLTTDGDGLITQEIPKTAVNASLTVEDSVAVNGKEVPIERHLDLQIGYLDPLDTESGQLARLASLGYYRGPLSPTDPDEFLSSIEEFQCENSLTVDGICGPQTQAKLKTVHGC